MFRTSGQPQVKLSLLYSALYKFSFTSLRLIPINTASAYILLKVVKFFKLRYRWGWAKLGGMGGLVGRDRRLSWRDGWLRWEEWVAKLGGMGGYVGRDGWLSWKG